MNTFAHVYCVDFNLSCEEFIFSAAHSCMYLLGCVTILPHDLYLNFRILLSWGGVVYDNVKDSIPHLCTIHQAVQICNYFCKLGRGKVRLKYETFYSDHVLQINLIQMVNLQQLVLLSILFFVCNHV